MNSMKYPAHSRYAGVGRSPRDSRIQDISHENAVMYVIYKKQKDKI